MTATAAEPSQLWQKNYGTDKIETCYSVWQTSDLGYILTGVSPETYESSDKDRIYLIKTDASGNVVWSKIYGNAARGYSVRQTTDGGYIVAGVESDYLCLYKTDASGNVLWSKSYKGPNGEETIGYSIQQTDDYGYIVAGSLYTYEGGPNWNPYILRVDENGNKLWEKSLGGSENAQLYSVDIANDAGFVFGGVRSSVNDGDSMFSEKPYIVKMDKNGNIQWEVTYNRDSWDNHEGMAYVQQTSDGGYMWAGNEMSTMYLLKADGNGVKSWDRKYELSGLKYECYSAQQAWDGGYILAGNKQDAIEGGDYNVAIVRTDASGNELWHTSAGEVGQDLDDKGYSVIQIGEGPYIVAGSSISHNTGAGGFPDAYMVKLEKDFTPAPNAEFYHDTIPSVMDAGKTYNVFVAFTNNGTKPWTFQDKTYMAPLEEVTDDAALFGVTQKTVRIGRIVRPGQTYYFNITLTAPEHNGTYNPQIGMVLEGRGRFGAICNKTVTVQNGLPELSPTPKPSKAPTATPSVVPTPTQNTGTATPTPAQTGGGNSLCPMLLLPLMAVGVVSLGMAYKKKQGR